MPRGPRTPPPPPPAVPPGAVLLHQGEDFTFDAEGVALTDAGLEKCRVFGDTPTAVTVDVHLRGAYLVVSRRGKDRP